MEPDINHNIDEVVDEVIDEPAIETNTSNKKQIRHD